jgi:hypothetical protein
VAIVTKQRIHHPPTPDEVQAGHPLYQLALINATATSSADLGPSTSAVD